MALKANLTNQQPILKRLYPSGVEKVVYESSRLFERCTKDTKFTNEDLAVVVRVSGTSGGSANFSDALASQGASQRARFIVNRKKEYQLYSVDGETIAATNGDPKAIVSVLKNEMTEAMYKFGRAMARRASGKGGGAIGVVDSTTVLSSTTLKFASRTDMQWLEVGDYVQFADGDGTDASADPDVDLRGSGASLRVVAIDRQAGTATMSDTLDTVTGVAVLDYVFRRGDYSRAMTGLQGWAPVADPSAAESFFGIDRTDYDLVRVAGFRYTAGAGGAKQDILIKGCAEAAIHGIQVSSLYMSSIDFGDFVIEIGAQRLRDESDSAVGYKYIDVYTPAAKGGTLRVIAEPCLPVGYAWAINDSDFKLRTAGACPSMLDHAGLGGRGMLMPQDDDAVQGRLGCYGNFTLDNPGNAIVFDLAA